MKKKKTNKKSAFILINMDGEGVFLGQFDDLPDAIYEAEQRGLSEGLIYEVVKKFDVMAPDEPEYECEEVDL